MRWWLNPLKAPVVIMLTVVMSFFFLLPPRMHLVLCVGSDGHMDIVEKACTSNCLPPHSPHDNSFSKEKHHLDCLDILIACSSCEQLICSEKKNNFSATNAKQALQQVIGLIDIGISPISDHKDSFFLGFNPQNLQPQILGFLKTIVLLV